MTTTTTTGHERLEKQRDLTSDQALLAARTHAKGQYQLAVLDGYESLSGASLGGRASSYAGRYAGSRYALLARVWAAGIPVWVELVDSRRYVLRFGAASKGYVDARRPSTSWCPAAIPVMRAEVLYRKLNMLPGADQWRWDVPEHLRGQIVEVAYSDGPSTDRYECGRGSRYQRVTDRSDGSVAYYMMARV